MRPLVIMSALLGLTFTLVYIIHSNALKVDRNTFRESGFSCISGVLCEKPTLKDVLRAENIKVHGMQLKHIFTLAA